MSKTGRTLGAAVLLALAAATPFKRQIYSRGAEIYNNIRQPSSIPYESFKPGDENKFLPYGCKPEGTLRRDILVQAEQAMGLSPLDLNEDRKEDFVKLCSVNGPRRGHADYLAGAISSPEGYKPVRLKIREKGGEKLILIPVRKTGKPDELLVETMSVMSQEGYLVACELDKCSVTPTTIDEYCSVLAIKDGLKDIGQICWNTNCDRDEVRLHGEAGCWNTLEKIAARYKPMSLVPFLRDNANNSVAVRALGNYKEVLKPWDIAGLCPNSTCLTASGPGWAKVTDSEIFRAMKSLAMSPEEAVFVADYLEGIIMDKRQDDRACSNKRVAMRELASMSDSYAKAAAGRVAFSPYLPECLSEQREKLQQQLMPQAFR
ncbi:MAG: hypothetical protein HY513_05615 [Candidatus Aenigmarchaeota archaeon]|nr:hypothetical protein [Candidatus Aenigmarchaeota archaeon]